MRDMTLQKLADFNSSLETTRASIAESKRRIADLEKQQQSTPSRLTTQMQEGRQRSGYGKPEIDAADSRE